MMTQQKCNVPQTLLSDIQTAPLCCRSMLSRSFLYHVSVSFIVVEVLKMCDHTRSSF